jgi:hypothetical protein
MPVFRETIAKFDPSRLASSISGYRFISSLAPAILLLLILILFFANGLFSSNVIGSTHPDTDLGYFMALRDYAFYGNSSFPLWNPYVMCGVPLIAEIHRFPFSAAWNCYKYLSFLASVPVGTVYLLIRPEAQYQSPGGCDYSPRVQLLRPGFPAAVCRTSQRPLYDCLDTGRVSYHQKHRR